MFREHWSNSLGFVLASIGCAIGLGNIWLFPWRLSAYGSVSFLIPYFIFTFGFVIAGLMAELALGRKTQQGTIGAFEQAFPPAHIKRARVLGIFQIMAQTGILVFYSIALAWILRYMFESIVGFNPATDPAKAFDSFAGTPKALLWHLGAVAITAGCVVLGVKRGLERINRIAVPGLFVIFALLLFKSLSLPGAMQGARDLLDPKWYKLLEPETWVMALGQSFFTVSLGGMLIYGSYLDKKTDIPKTSVWIVCANSAASMLAALIIIPAVSAFGLDPARGPGLLFITIPHLLKLMPAGYIFGLLFFTSVALAGISSAVNLLEIPVEALMHLSGAGRKKATLWVCTLSFAAGIPLCLNMSYFALFADAVTIYIYPLGVLAIAVVAQWIMGADKIRAEINTHTAFPIGRWLVFHLRYVFITACVVVLGLGIMYNGIS